MRSASLTLLVELEISLMSKQMAQFRKGSRISSKRLLSDADDFPSMPYKVYHGKTGVVYNVTKSAVGVIIYKKVGNRYIEKRVNVRVEHVNHSRSRDEFLTRVKDNAAKKIKAKEEGVHMHLKRQPAMPRESRKVEMTDGVETITPIPYETTI
jgi:large subunit ribosomal protein L21e